MPFKAFREFARLETSAGLILFLTATLALIIDNSPLASYYEALFNLRLSFGLPDHMLTKPLITWINDGLMTLFFLLVGLEIKREILIGELNNFKKSLLPAIAAFGGMLVPASIYIAFNWGNSLALQGWAIPVATDIAFSLGILAVLGNKHVPVPLKIFLTALAIFDDIGAIVIIAIFYTSHISLILLLVALGLLVLLFFLNYLNIRYISVYLALGFLLWLCVLNSGVHATLAGVLIAFAIPLGTKENSPLEFLEKDLHPWVAFVVLPVFAFANAGVSFSDLSWKEILSPITLGIAAGLFFGKQIGVFMASYLSIATGVAQRPRDTELKQVYGAGLIAGVGFTMSLFIGGLAFGNLGDFEAMVRLGVILGSFFSGISGYFLLRSCQSRT